MFFNAQIIKIQSEILKTFHRFNDVIVFIKDDFYLYEASDRRSKNIN